MAAVALPGYEAAATTTALPPRMPALDGLRAIAVLLVMFHHYEVRDWPWRTGLAWPAWAVFREGWVGVDLFFVISGFLITGILHDTKGEHGFFRTFYARRTLRIFPIYYAYLLAMFVALPLLPHVSPWQAPVPASVQAWSWTYTSNILIGLHGFGASPVYVNHFWSLAVEEQFYLLWPALVFVSTRRQMIGICVGAIAVALAFRAGLKLADASWMANFALTPARIDSLALGALVALVARGPRGAELLARHARALALAGLVAFVALFQWRGLVGPDDNALRTVGYTVVAFFFAGVVAVAATARPGTLAWRLLTGRVLRQVGKYSYAMYVLHFAVRGALDLMGFSLPGLVTSLGSVAAAHAVHLLANTLATFGAAALSWHLLEGPILRLKERFPYAQDARGAAR